MFKNMFQQPTFIDTLQDAVRKAGATEQQAGHFLLWLGNELFEERLLGDVRIMELRATELAGRFMRETTER